MGVVWRADNDSIDLLADLVKHHSVIFKFAGLVKLLETLPSFGLIHVAHGDDVLTGHTTDICRTASADTDTGNIKFFIC